MAAEGAQLPFVTLSDLDEPPEAWRLVREREAELKKSFHLCELRALLQYHGYGFECKKHFGLKQKYIDLLHKILYYTQTGLGNNSAFTQRGIICAGPVGPGTLSSKVRSSRGLPAWYLTENAALEKIRPHPSLRSALLDPRNKPAAHATCYSIAPGVPSYTEADAADGEGSFSTYDSEPLKAPSASPGPAAPTSIHKSQHSDSVVVLSDDSSDHNDDVRDSNHDDDDDNADSFAASQNAVTSKRNGDSSARIQNTIAEQVRKAIVTSAYSGLNVVPDPFLHPSAFVFANNAGDLLRRLTQGNIASSHFGIRSTGNGKYIIDKRGAPRRYHGRGPVWHDNSCYWDSIIVSCLSLDAGFTYLDRGTSPDTWGNGLTTIQRAFLDVLRMDWSFFDKETSIAQRDMFLELFQREWRDEGLTPTPRPKGEMDSPAARWNDIAGPFNQFSFTAHQRRRPCVCQKRSVQENAPTEVRYVTPPFQASDGNGVTVADLLQRWSHFILPHCQSGAKETQNVIQGNLPLRMVLQVTSGSRLLQHTSQDIAFSYTRIEPGSGKELRARITYRWLGGVYCSGAHFRVFWNDSPSGATTVESLRVYDGMEAAGAILGGVPPASQPEPIPDEWMKYCPPLLFYEQVVDPGSLALEAARSVITDMILKQPDRSVFPDTFLPVTSHSDDTITGTDALLPRELPQAILKVEGPSATFHIAPGKTAPIMSTSPSIRETRRSKRHTLDRRHEDSPQTRTPGQEANSQTPPGAPRGGSGKKNGLLDSVSTPPRTSNRDGKRKRSD